jgi:hypothetical protein
MEAVVIATSILAAVITTNITIISTVTMATTTITDFVRSLGFNFLFKGGNAHLQHIQPECAVTKRRTR